MLKTKLTGVDSSTTFVLNFDKVEAQVGHFDHVSGSYR